MRIIILIIILIYMVLSGLNRENVVYLKYQESERHIEYLEDFITENHLPTPARKQ